MEQSSATIHTDSQTKPINLCEFTLSWPRQALPKSITGDKDTDTQLYIASGLQYIFRMGYGETQVSWEGDDAWFIENQGREDRHGHGNTMLNTINDIIVSRQRYNTKWPNKNNNNNNDRKKSVVKSPSFLKVMRPSLTQILGCLLPSAPISLYYIGDTQVNVFTGILCSGILFLFLLNLCMQFNMLIDIGNMRNQKS